MTINFSYCFVIVKHCIDDLYYCTVVENKDNVGWIHYSNENDVWSNGTISFSFEEEVLNC